MNYLELRDGWETRMLNPRTKRAKAFIDDYFTARAKGYTTIYDVYERMSPDKWGAYIDCVRKMEINDGEFPAILSHNQWSFTFGYMYKDDNGKWLVVETVQNIYAIKLD